MKQRRPTPPPGLPLTGDNAIPPKTPEPTPCSVCGGEGSYLTQTIRPFSHPGFNMVHCTHCNGTGAEPGSGEPPKKHAPCPRCDYYMGELTGADGPSWFCTKCGWGGTEAERVAGEPPRAETGGEQP